MDGSIEHRISNLIRYQFPRFYEEEGPLFIAFMKAYYEWMEQEEGILYYARRYYELKDIDATFNSFLVYFKEKYLKNIRLTSQTNTRQLTKHSLDLYRSKGTERGIDLLFRAVFGVETDIYYPGDDIFRLSDGHWAIPRYLEVSLNNDNALFLNKQVRGISSGATAFVEQVVRRSVKGKLLDLLYISAIHGSFQTGERLTDDVRDVRDCPAVVGSLTSIAVAAAGSGSGFNVGDIVLVHSPSGEQARARVTSISDITGIIGVELLFGGYGFSASAEILVSEKVLSVANVQASNGNSYFGLFETVTQPMGNINYENLTGGTFAINNMVYTYWANNLLKGTGRILEASNTSPTEGELFVIVLSGDLDDNTVWTTANAVSANQTVANGFFDRTATGNVIGTSANIFLTVSGIQGNFAFNEIVSQDSSEANGLFFSKSETAGANGVLKLVDTSTNHVFTLGNTIRGETSDASANVQSITVDIGVMDISSSFVSTNGNYLYCSSNSGNVNGTITEISTGSGVSFDIGTLSHTETVLLDLNYIRDYALVEIDALAYGFPDYPTGNLTHGTIHDNIPMVNHEIGKVAALTNISKGENYNKAPIINIFEPVAYNFRVQDGILNLTSTGNFVTGEEITQEATGGRGIVKTSNSSIITYERLRLLDEDDFIPTSNSSTVLVGEESGAEANIAAVIADTSSRFLGYNAIIDNSVLTSNGAINALDIIDSGFGYIPDEQVVLQLSTNSQLITSGYGELGTQGRGTGYYKDRGGFLCDQKKIHDGYYYQEYSYEIRSSLSLDKYIDMLKQVMHMAGTKVFGAIIHKSIVASNIGAKDVEIAVETQLPPPSTSFGLGQNSQYVPLVF